jgi:tRNA (guanine10-N2)-dimethyltransferase
MVDLVLEEIRIGLLLSKTNLYMSRAEAIESCKIYFEIASIENINGTNSTGTDSLLILKIKTLQNEQTINRILNWLGRLALTKDAYLIAGYAKVEGDTESLHTKFYLEPFVSSESSIIEQITNQTRNKDVDKDAELTFKVSSKNTGDSQRVEDRNLILNLAKELTLRGFNKTSMKSPSLEFTLLKSSTTLVGLKLWTNTNDFEERKAHLRPILHPTAINPKLARAMINLVRAEKEISDPFCGCGGILLEGMLIGLQVKGTDISPEMINKSKLNLRDAPNFERAELQCKDALLATERVECVVTDLPYGKSSKIQGSVSSMLNRFLIHYANLTSKIAVCFPRGTDFSIPENWNKKYEFSIYIHKSLSRNILILEKNN